MIHINFLHHNSYKLTLPKIDYSKYQAQKTAFLPLVATGKTAKRSKIPSSVGSGHLGKLLCKGLVITKGDFKDIAMEKKKKKKNQFVDQINVDYSFAGTKNLSFI